MTKPRSSQLCWRLISAALPLLVGCSLIFPSRIERTIQLVAQEGQEGDYRKGEDGSVSYLMEGLRIEVKYMTDRELNELFPQESNLEEYSINPYTYGNHVDPAVGYVQNRFTVFRVGVHNSTFAKVELDPLKAVLTTDREGEVHNSYSVLQTPRRKNFESYYRALRGPSGNDYYRYNMRMGLVRSNNYGIDEKIFKGESYEGFIVFESLDDEVETVRLQLRDFVLKFNAFNQPIETVDIAFAFDRQVTQEVFEQEAVVASREVTRAEVIAPSKVLGNIPGDLTREVRTIDALATTHLSSINQCFEKEYEAGSAAEGEVKVSFVILPVGTVESARIVSSTVVSDAVGECIAAQVRRWRFQPSRVLEPEIQEEAEPAPGARPGEVAPSVRRAEQPSLTASRVTATCTFEFIDIRPD